MSAWGASGSPCGFSGRERNTMAIATRWSLIKDIIGGLAFIIVGGVFLREMTDLPANVVKYPSIIIYLIFGLCLILVAKSVAALASGKYSPARTSARTESREDGDAVPAEETDKFGFPTIFVIVLSFLYVLAMPYIGFTLASGIMMILFMLAMGIRSPYILVLVPVIEIAFLLYVFEKLLAVFLPGADPLKALLGIA